MSILQGTSGVNDAGEVVPAGQETSSMQAKMNEAVESARTQLKTAVAEAVAAQVPAIINSSEALLNECDLITTTLLIAQLDKLSNLQ